jgi:hypothetical protein
VRCLLVMVRFIKLARLVAQDLEVLRIYLTKAGER